MPGINDSKVVLVIGATSGIGRALALAIHDLPTKPVVIVTGRRQERLDELVAKGKESGEGRIRAIQFDVSGSKQQLRSFVDDVIAKYPQLDTVIFSAGIQQLTDLSKPENIDLDKLTDEFNINYVSILTLIMGFLPHLLKLSATGLPTFIVPITSALAILPAPTVVGYCATKAALHSLSLSLHKQLKNTNVHVMEIIPPLVESELHDHQGNSAALAKVWMPLDEYTKYTMEGLARGDVQITCGPVTLLHEKFEKDKLEIEGLQAFKDSSARE